jgi:glycosyltransferase involved in cell wall biosynthesis
MKICFVVKELDFFISHRLDLAANLAKKNNVCVITNSKHFSKEQVDQIYNNGIAIYNLENRVGSVNIFSYFRYVISLRKIISKIKPDFIFYVTLEMSFFGALINNSINIKKSFFLITGLGPFFFNPKFKYRLARIIQKISFVLCKYRNEQSFIFQNLEDLDTFVDLGFSKKSQSILIPGNGINTGYFCFYERAQQENIVFLFASRLTCAKGFNEFMSAASSLGKKYHNSKFLIAGKYDPSDPDSISEDAFQEMINSKQISYMGELAYGEMRNCFNQSSVLVMPSYGEGLPKVALEAASTGLPLIVSDVRGCRDCVETESNGLLIRPRNAQDLEDAMESFISLNQTTLREYGKSSCAMVKSKFSLDLITEEYLKLLEV